MTLTITFKSLCSKAGLEQKIVKTLLKRTNFDSKLNIEPLLSAEENCCSGEFNREVGLNHGISIALAVKRWTGGSTFYSRLNISTKGCIITFFFFFFFKDISISKWWIKLWFFITKIRLIILYFPKTFQHLYFFWWGARYSWSQRIKNFNLNFNFNSVLICWNIM